MKLLLVSQFDLLYVPGVCGCWRARQEGCLHGTRRGVLQAQKVPCALQTPSPCSWISYFIHSVPLSYFRLLFAHIPLLQEMSHCPGASLIYETGGQMDELVPHKPGGEDTETARSL